MPKKLPISVFNTTIILGLHSALDLAPCDHELREALSDAMRDVGDPRADGMLALARCERCPIRRYRRILTDNPLEGYCWYVFSNNAEYTKRNNAVLPQMWILANVYLLHAGKLTRRQAEGDAAAAFMMLPIKDRMRYLAGDLG